MNTLLHIDSSFTPRGSVSRKLTAEFVSAWRAERAGEKVIYRDLDRAPVPAVDHDLVAATAAAPGALLPDGQKRALALSNHLIDELFEAGALVLGVPVTAFSVPATFKAWLDQVARDRVLRGGGALKGRKALVIATLGDSDPSGKAAARAFHEGYLRQVLGAFGITDVTWVLVARAPAPEAAALALEEARLALRATLERWNADEEAAAREVPNKAAA
ncbi:MAG: FMN-dependent NADH-azoreductase 1 [Fibrobacteria bacterium]|jgi:FMN-dependent NADH-azoreductase|nr:FMN-dependent NADH-azoreductase 1 [Fibrobacteria bacterium]